ncbi:MAG: hypothetical protein ACNA8W_14030 [Bradymonadaceae bacterium]
MPWRLSLNPRHSARRDHRQSDHRIPTIIADAIVSRLEIERACDDPRA